jgi:hypothetical protein
MQEVKISTPPPQEGGRGGLGFREGRGVTGSWQWDLRQNRVFEKGGGGGKRGVEETAEEVAARYLCSNVCALSYRSLLTFVGLF